MGKLTKRFSNFFSLLDKKNEFNDKSLLKNIM